MVRAGRHKHIKPILITEGNVMYWLPVRCQVELCSVQDTA